ncbi:TIGR01459 family HAD-type hydrolase [Aestuariivirga litoralis]|uniref:TIGR01459 family HAD-type hydrolase n=1 Tax=Aestuariivirga litoralis TaxID=2650924 RepID=UPI0018C83883|nr:TIGR01459 family HAD-type hydrolase [Aestuariivirga litoralis]MBG1233437.1 TIGR01459 family HAD-type hydrolase [Aestuariivirga litoralis]
MKQLSARFPIWLCDVWGVAHDGRKPIPHAVDALIQHRRAGGKVVFITNAPTPKLNVQAFIDKIGVPREAYDDMVTSGDVTRELMVELGDHGLYHLGPPEDLPIFKGLEVKRVPLEQAGAVLCTGFIDEVARAGMKIDHALLEQFLSRGLTMICANPDKVVSIGGVLIPCAGAIAEVYGQMGGRVMMAGKPFAPIYDVALKHAGHPDHIKVLAIGDGPDTDVKGAMQNNLPCVFVSGGINKGADPEAEVRARYPDARIMKVMPELYWT